MIGELDREAVKGALVQAVEKALDDHPGQQRREADAGQDGGIEIAVRTATPSAPSPGRPPVRSTTARCSFWNRPSPPGRALPPRGASRRVMDRSFGGLVLVDMLSNASCH